MATNPARAPWVREPPHCQAAAFLVPSCLDVEWLFGLRFIQLELVIMWTRGEHGQNEAHCDFMYRDHHGFSLARKNMLNHQVALRIVLIMIFTWTRKLLDITGPYATTIHPKGANWSTTLLGCPCKLSIYTIQILAMKTPRKQRNQLPVHMVHLDSNGALSHLHMAHCFRDVMSLGFTRGDQITLPGGNKGRIFQSQLMSPAVPFCNIDGSANMTLV